MRTQSVEDTVREMLARELELEPASIGEQTSTEDTSQWDSAAHVEIVFAIEDHFGIEFSQEEIEEMYSFSEMVAMIKSKL